MNFNQRDEQNEMYRQMEAYFLKSQNKWYSGSHNLVQDDHPVSFLTLDDTFFKPPIDQEEPLELESIDSFFKDKLTLNKLHVTSLVSQIYKRNEIKKDNLYRIDLDMIKCQTKLFEMEQTPRVFNQTLARARSTFEKELLALEKEKRAEYVSWWRDLVLVKRDLIQALKEWKSSESRLGLILESNPQPLLERNNYQSNNEHYR